MSRMSKADQHKAWHREALSRFDATQSALRDERLQCLQDRRFYSIAGAQWEGPLGEQFENKPKFEVNKIHLSVIRIFNEYRQNRITADFISKEGNEYDALADTCDGLFRADMQDSGGEEAFDNAFEEAVGGGFGAIRLCTAYEDEEDDEDERQRIKIEPIYDADSSVYFDLAAKRQDKADAQWAIVLTSYTRDDYIAEFEDDPASWPKEVHQYEFDWLTPDVVFVAEYYFIEQVKHTVYVYERIDGEEERYTDQQFEDDPELEATLTAKGSRRVREKRVKKKKVRKLILSGAGVLEDCGYIAGSCIPIVPVYGKRWFVDNIERCMGHVRLAKDAQRLKNMQLSKLAEVSALSSIEKPIFTPEQVAGLQIMWQEDNLKNYPYLLVNPVTDGQGGEQVAGPVGYTRVPQVAPAMAALLQLTETDMQDLLGNQQGADKVMSNVSGDAVDMIQQRLDMQAFIYMSNMAKAVRRVGEVWLSMAREVYTEPGRKMKSIGMQGEIESVELMRPVMNDDGEYEIENDLSEAKFDVAVDVGPSSSSRRNAIVRQLANMIQFSDDPQTRSVLQAAALMNMEGEGLQEIREYFRKVLVRAGVSEPTEEEAQQMAMAGQQPDPQAQYLTAAAEEASAKAAQARATTVKTIADAELTRAKTAKTISEIDTDVQDRAIQMAEQLQPVDIQAGIRPAGDMGEI